LSTASGGASAGESTAAESCVPVLVSGLPVASLPPASGEGFELADDPPHARGDRIATEAAKANVTRYGKRMAGRGKHEEDAGA
jgi:hypothetical protein